MTAFMRAFHFLSLFLVIIINYISFTNETTTPDTMSTIYSQYTITYAEQQQEQPAARTQEWVDKQSNMKLLFAYSPKPLVGTSTELMFDILDLGTGTHFKDVFATLTIIDGLQQQVPLKFYKVTAPNGHFSIKYQFGHEGTYQIIVKVNSKDSALALASFKIVVPFQPFGVFNINHIFPLLNPVVLVGIIGAMAILAFIIVVNKKQK
jgi:hypothetical protein